MTVYIALLRGINVGGNTKVAMADVRAAFAAAGATEVVTYIQSGNAVFVHAARAEAALVADLERELETATGKAVPVMVRTAKQWDEVVAHNPYDASDPTKVHVAFLADRVKANDFAAIDAAAFVPETWTVHGREVYVALPNGMGRAKLPIAFGKVPAFKVATYRNWRTVLKLQELAASIG